MEICYNCFNKSDKEVESHMKVDSTLKQVAKQVYADSFTDGFYKVDVQERVCGEKVQWVEVNITKKNESSVPFVTFLCNLWHQDARYRFWQVSVLSAKPGWEYSYDYPSIDEAIHGEYLQKVLKDDKLDAVLKVMDEAKVMWSCLGTKFDFERGY